jgi:hypothetical protein
MKQSESKYNVVTRDLPFPEARAGRVATADGTRHFDGVELPSGRRYVVTGKGWRRVINE